MNEPVPFAVAASARDLGASSSPQFKYTVHARHWRETSPRAGGDGRAAPGRLDRTGINAARTASCWVAERKRAMKVPQKLTDVEQDLLWQVQH